MFANNFGAYKGVECGLCCVVESETHPIPLQSLDVTASVVHAVSQVQVTQVFINKEQQPIEAIYFFPVDSNGAVTQFEAEIDGRKIKGIVKAHEDAKEEYEKAIELGQTASLGEQNEPDIFKVKIGFLKPGNRAKITLAYTSEVKNEKDSNSIRFFVPTTVAPRYVPKRCDDEKSEDLRKMEFSESSPAPMSIKVTVSIQGEIKSIESPTHAITVVDKVAVPEKTNWSRAVVELSGKTTDMDRDFVLLVTPTETHKPRLYVEKLEKSFAVMAHLIPSFKLDEENAELIFVLDRSGSMQGKSIELAKKALTLFLHSLPADCYFNIVGFGSSYKLLFSKSVKYDDNSLKKARAYAKALQADMGGTEILEPLKEIFSSETIPGYLRQIFVITDGEVSNTDEIIGLTKAKAHESRVFCLGMGDSASHHLVDGVAQAGGGTSAFVTYNETVDKKVLQQLKDALQPSLTNVKLTWQGVTLPSNEEHTKPIEINKEKTLMGYGKPKDATDSSPSRKLYRQAPEKIPPIFDGSQLVVFGVFENSEEKPTSATITADSPDGPLSLVIELTDDNDVGKTGMIHKLAAIKIVREIELKVAALGFSRHRHQRNETTEELEASYEKEITEIAVKEGLATKYTSFVAVDTSSDNKTPDNWAMQTRLVPSQLAHGWYGGSGSLGMMAFYKLDMMPSVNCLQIPMCSIESSEVDMDRSICQKSSLGQRKRTGFFSMHALRKVISRKASPMKSVAMKFEDEDKNIGGEVTIDKLHDIISYQSFDGCFKWNDDLIRLIASDRNLAREHAKKQGWNLDAWLTTLALTFLSERLGDQKDSWDLVATKARKWMNKNHADLLDAMLSASVQFIQV